MDQTTDIPDEMTLEQAQQLEWEQWETDFDRWLSHNGEFL